MKKKIVCIAIVSMFLLVSVNVVSKSTNKIKETKISNALYNDCPCKNELLTLDPEIQIWYPSKFITCGILRVMTFIVGILQPNTPWGLIALAQSLECDWALDLPIP